MSQLRIREKTYSAGPLTALLLLCIALFFFALGRSDLQDSTEPRVAGIAMQMYLEGDWIVPRLNGEAFLEKPPLSVWLDAGAIALFGAEPWAVRLPGALAGMLGVLILYLGLQALQRPRALAWTAAAMLATTASYWAHAREVGEDALLGLGVLLTLLGVLLGEQRLARARAVSAGAWGMVISGIALATLSKGMLGLALPGVVIFAFRLVDSLRRRRLQAWQWLWPALATLVGLLPFIAWLYALYHALGHDGLTEVLWTNSAGRFSGSYEYAGHFEPFYYYLGKLPEAFLPWNLLVYLGLWHFRRELLGDRYRLFMALWLVAQFFLLSLASSKRMSYLVSATPAAAVIAAEYVWALAARVRDHPRWARVARRGPRLGVALLGLVTLGYLLHAGWIQPRADREASLRPVIERLRAHQTAGHQVILFAPSERLSGAVVFYSAQTLPIIRDSAALTDYLRASPRHLALLQSEQPPPPWRVRDALRIGRRLFYFVGE